MAEGAVMSRRTLFLFTATTVTRMSPAIMISSLKRRVRTIRYLLGSMVLPFLGLSNEEVASCVDWLRC
jgi:hypothetical protein